MTETQRMLALLNESFPDIASLAPLEARSVVDARVRPPTNIHDVADVTDESIGGADRWIALRVYHPHDPDASMPPTVFAHGGGFLHGSIASHDGFCQRWARGTRGVVVSVDYGLAPEHHAPEPLEDMLAAVSWTVAARLGARGVIVAGDSAGGNLAAGVALTLRGEGSPVRGQVLLYPMLDPAMDTASYRTRATGFFVTARLLDAYWRNYLGHSPARTQDWRICPAAAKDLDRLAPAIVVTAGLDPLSDEGAGYAETIRAASVPVLHRRYPDQFHGFATIADFGPAVAAQSLLWADIRRLFRNSDTKETP